MRRFPKPAGPRRSAPRRTADLIVLALAALVLAGATCPRAGEGPGTRSATLLVTSSLEGQLEPFSEPTRTGGGLARIAALVRQARQGPGGAIWVDAGDALFGRLDVPPDLLPQYELKAKAIAESYSRVGVDAFVAGERDLLRGAEFLRKTGLRRVLNAGFGPDDAPSLVLRSAGGVRVGFVAASGRGEARPIGELAARARREGAEIVVALVQASPSEAAAILERIPEGAVDLAIASHAPSAALAEGAVQEARAPIFGLPSMGRAVLRLDVSMLEGAAPGAFVAPSEEERRSALSRLEALLAEAEDDFVSAARDARVVALRQRVEEARRPQEVPEGRNRIEWRFLRVAPGSVEDEEIRETVRRYAHEVERLNGEPRAGDACNAGRTGQPLYIGAGESCARCHPDQLQSWRGTAHARAFEVLKELGRSHDLECARCHVTGLLAPGGVCQIGLPRGREGVQCEACHGPASVHAESPKRPLAVINEGTCRACHTPDHDPGFRYDRDRRTVVGPKHGQPRHERE